AAASFFFSSRRRHTMFSRDWSSDVCSSDLSPLLRGWLARLATAGATIRTRWRWLGWQGTAARFATPDGERRIKAAATVLALGGEIGRASCRERGEIAGVAGESGKTRRGMRD